MTDQIAHILVVDDDERLRKLLKKFLGEQGFIVSVADNALDAKNKISLLEFDLIVLDWMMPGQSGIDFAKEIRPENDTPILMLTAMSESDDRISGLEVGVEDYLTKPFEPRELVLRIQNILRRIVRNTPTETNATITMGLKCFDLNTQILDDQGTHIHLTASEASLLSLFCQHLGDILSREELAERLGLAANDRTIDVQVTRLRRKIEEDPKMPRFLQTVRGQGYVLRADQG